MRNLIIIAALLLSGCDYALRIPYPKVAKVDRGLAFLSEPTSSSIQPSNPGFGETVTLTYSNLHPDLYHSVYLSFGEISGGDPDRPTKIKGAPYFKIGNLAPVGNVATISFDLRPVMGNDQNGDPFKLSRGQLVTYSLKSERQDQPGTYGFQGGGSNSFLIK